ncbi:MAG: GTPase, partial [Candidatus Diapherotrites archaeon]|nr:GTPase [Candidatus Diapherotrites archaeon]
MRNKLPVPIIIMGAAGRDFHNYLAKYKDHEIYKVVAFTATQIPGIDGREFPASLAGKLYPKGIPIHPEEELEEIIDKYDVEQCILAYSDLSYPQVMHIASRVLAAGADFKLMGPKTTMYKSKKPVIAVCAVRTGCGKSQTTRAIVKMVKKLGKKPVVVRHPMPYGQLDKQACEIFRTYQDLEKYNVTIEEREEYEKHIEEGTLLMAGVDYQQILKAAEREGDVIVWDGGNNDIPFYYPDLHLVITDALRPGHEKSYYPGEVNARMADVIIINKENTAKKKDIQTIKDNIKELNPKAIVIEADSTVSVTHPESVKGKSVLVVEDGPTLTHGGMAYGAGIIAAKKFKAKKIVNPKPYAVGS